MFVNWIVNVMTVKQISVILIFVHFLLLIDKNQAYFGLSSKMHISSSSLMTYYYSLNQSNIREMCNLFGLSERQKRFCKQEKGMAVALFEAFKLSVLECQRQFEKERWNCATIDTVSKTNLLKKTFKETAFLFAISSSSLVHSLSRACSNGQLTHCTCDESLETAENRQTWLWAGCGDNIRFGQKFGWKFLQFKKQNSNDLRARIDRHNAEVGVKVVKDMVIKRCKCNGVSGTCAMKTCWKQLVNFNDVGRSLKHKYEAAISIDSSNEASRTYVGSKSPKPNNKPLYREKQKMMKKSAYNASQNDYKKEKGVRFPSLILGSKPKELVYLDRSPDFCHKSKYSAGTKGRECFRESSCKTLCCGRGHNTQVINVTSSCNCKIIWCCNLECQVCRNQTDIYTCK